MQIVTEVFIEFGLGSIGESLRQRSRAHPVVAGVGIALLGGLAGALTTWILPTRIFQPAPLPGASLLVSPLITGAVMDRYGQWREDRGVGRSYVATLWGGALFAFSMALVRFVWVEA